MYAAVDTTLYRWFAIVGAVSQVGSILLAAIMTVLVRGRGAAFRWTLAGAIGLALAFVVWLAVVAPVNATVAAARHDDAASVPQL